jgi:hypothetical protein
MVGLLIRSSRVACEAFVSETVGKTSTAHGTAQERVIAERDPPGLDGK